jgi:ribosome-binding factor A
MLKLFVPTKAPSHRQERVAEEVRFLLCQQLQRDSLPIERDEDNNLLKPQAPITITELTVSPDLRHAQVGVMPLGGIGQEIVVKFMRANAWYLRKSLAKQLKTRIAPELDFYLDNHFDQAAKIDALIVKIHSKNE